MSNTWILIPPSEGKQSGGEGPPIQPSPPVQEMIARLQGYEGDWGKLLGVKGKALEEAIAANQSLLKAPTLPAIERYTGVVYDALDYPTLPARAQRFADKHLRIVSGLFGLLKPADPIPNYRLKIDKLDAARFWRQQGAEAFQKAYVIDLLPQAHRKAVDYPQGVAVDFLVEKQGKRVSAGHFGKHIKGRFVRWLCQNQVTDPAAFEDFREEGFEWNGSAFLKRQ